MTSPGDRQTVGDLARDLAHAPRDLFRMLWFGGQRPSPYRLNFPLRQLLRGICWLIISLLPVDVFIIVVLRLLPIDDGPGLPDILANLLGLCLALVTLVSIFAVLSVFVLVAIPTASLERPAVDE